MSENVKNELYHLPPSTILNQRYRIEKVIGSGGFGITYVCTDLKLDMKLAVKEYFPNSLSTRNTQANFEITPNQNDFTIYQKGKNSFLKEARLLAKLVGEAGIVGVRDYFEENNTCYIVMDFIDGVSLKEYLKTNGIMEFDDMLQLMTPLMNSLARVHEENIVHRDISPDNIMITAKGEVKLLDFGAARDIKSENNSTVILKVGFAPFEQYSNKSDLGPWTDIYALTATMYYCITGKIPPASIDRAINDELVKPSDLGVAIKPFQEKALLKGLAVFQGERYTNVRDLLEDLTKKEEYVIEEIPETCMQTGAGEEILDRYFTEPVSPPKVEQREFVPPVEEPMVEPVKEKKKKPAKEKKAKPVKEKKKGSGFGMIAGGLAGVAVLCLAIYLGFSMTTKTTIGDKSYSYDETYISVLGSKVSQGQLKKLHKFKKLSNLYLSGCFLTDKDVEIIADELAQIPFEDKNFSLTLASNQEITDISPLEKLEELHSVDISGDSVTDLSCLNKMEKLSSLDISDMKTEVDFNSLSGLKSLTYLNINNLEIQDISFINGMIELEYLLADDNQISDLTPVMNLSKLTNVNLTNNQITDLSPFALCDTKFETLELSDNSITDLSPLAGKLEELKQLEINNNKISDISVLKDSYELWNLSVEGCGLSDISVLAEKNELKFLYAKGNQISDISPLLKCHGMQNLDLSHNQISDLSPLAVYLEEGSALNDLKLDHNQISDISLLKDFSPEVCRYDFSCNQISDFTPLGDKVKSAYEEHYNRFQVYGNPFTDLQQLVDLPLAGEQGITLSYYEGMDWGILNQIEELNSITILDCPKEQEFYVEKALDDKYVSFSTLKEYENQADEDEEAAEEEEATEDDEQ